VAAAINEWTMRVQIGDSGGEQDLVTGPDENSITPTTLELRVSFETDLAMTIPLLFSLTPDTPLDGGPAGNQRACLVTPSHTFYTTPTTPYDIRYRFEMEQKSTWDPPDAPDWQGKRLVTIVDGTLNPWDMDPDQPGRQTKGIWRFGFDTLPGMPPTRSARGFQESYE
jgi:hypothetical protein